MAAAVARIRKGVYGNPGVVQRGVELGLGAGLIASETVRSGESLRRVVPDQRPSFRQRLRLAYAENPVRGMVLALLVLLALGFLVVGVVALGGPFLEWVLG